LLGTSSPSCTSTSLHTSRPSGTSSPSSASTPGTSSPSDTDSLSSISTSWVPPVPQVLSLLQIPPVPGVPPVPRIPPLPWILPVPWIPAMPAVPLVSRVPPVLRVPPVPPAPANHVDQSQRSLPFKYQTHVGGGGDDKTRPSPAHTLPLSRSNSRSDNRPSKCHPDVGCSQSSASYLPMGRVPANTRPAGPAKTMADDRRRRERVERCVDMCLFVLLVLICVGLAVCLVFMSF